MDRFRGGGIVEDKGGQIMELPPYVKVLSKNKLKVILDGGWQGMKTIMISKDDILKGMNDLGYGIYTKSCIVFKGIAFDWRNARDFFQEMIYVFKLLNEEI